MKTVAGMAEERCRVLTEEGVAAIVNGLNRSLFERYFPMMSLKTMKTVPVAETRRKRVIE